MGSRVKFHWSRPDLPAFCHIIELIARSPSTSVSWNHLPLNSALAYSYHALHALLSTFVIWRMLKYAAHLTFRAHAEGASCFTSSDIQHGTGLIA